jgi:hypothetical protein
MHDIAMHCRAVFFFRQLICIEGQEVILGFLTKRDRFSLRVDSGMYATLHTICFWRIFKYRMISTNFHLWDLSHNTFRCYLFKKKKKKKHEMGLECSMYCWYENAYSILIG